MYDLAGRGVRMVSGRSQDSDAADSNGAGKSALVMAPSWALSGRSDARLEVRSQLCSPFLSDAQMCRVPA